MSTKTILISHGNFAEGLKQTAQMIVGERDDLFAFGLQKGHHPDEVIAKVEELIEPGERVLIAADLAGGSVSNAALRLTTDENVTLIAGMNLPLVIQLLLTPPADADAVEALVAESRNALAPLVIKPASTDDGDFF